MAAQLLLLMAAQLLLLLFDSFQMNGDYARDSARG